MRTAPSMTYHDLSPGAAQLARAAERAAVQSLRRVPGTDGAEWNHRGGTLIDSTRLAARAPLPGARVFGRRADERGARPSCAVTVLLDDSGSMGAGQTVNGERMTRAHLAAAVCSGIVRGADSCGVPCSVIRHTTDGDAVHLEEYDSITALNSWTMYTHMAGNRDALAVIATAARVPFLAPRGVFVLVADGEPTDPEADHRLWCRDALRAVQRHGYAFVYAFVGHAGDAASVKRARREWGARRVADCSTNPAELARVMVAAAAACR